MWAPCPLTLTLPSLQLQQLWYKTVVWTNAVRLQSPSYSLVFLQPSDNHPVRLPLFFSIAELRRIQWELLNEALLKTSSSVLATGEASHSGPFYSLCEGFSHHLDHLWGTVFLKAARLRNRDLHLSPRGNYQMANGLFSLNDSERLTQGYRWEAWLTSVSK